MPYDDAARHAHVFPDLVEFGSADGCQHLVDGIERNTRIVRSPGITSGQGRTGILVIGKVHVNGSRKRANDLDALVARRVPNDGQRKTPATRTLDCTLNLQRVVGGRHEVHVERPLVLQPQADVGQAVAVDDNACTTLGNRGILTVHALQRTMREEHRTASRLPGQRRFLPKVKRGTRDENLVVRTADAPLARIAMCTTQPRTQIAGANLHGAHLLLLTDLRL